MSLTSHSEIGELRSVFLKRPAHAFLDENTLASEWKELNFLSKPDFDHAVKEYHVFESLLNSDRNKLHYFPSDPALSIDSIYCRDASVITDGGVILCNMGKANRRPEPKAARKTFELSGFKILGSIEAPGTLEGGDVAWLDTRTLAVGNTYRTNEEGIEQLRALLRPLGVNVLQVHLPHYKGPSDVFHLMSVLSPVDHDLAVVYSPLIPISFRKELTGMGYAFVEVPDEEFESMGCNVLALGPRKCLMVDGNPKTKARLLKAGCSVFEYAGNEISVKGGGGPTCLTRPMSRWMG